MTQVLTLEEIYSPVDASLHHVPETILDLLGQPNALAKDVIRYFFSGKGKLLRPALTLLGAATQQEEEPSQKILNVASAFEIFHGATLIHDDIIDSAYLRRNIPTINVKWGPDVAVLVGDYLHDKAMSTIYRSGKSEVFDLFLKTAGGVCDGEILELRENSNFALSETEYLEIIRKKTAILLACCLESGGRMAGAGEDEARALYQFGLKFGLAFQIVDDCLDITGQEEEFGKTLGADLSAGVLTLPLIRLLQVVESSRRTEIYRVFKLATDKDKVARLLELMREHEAIEYARARAHEFAEQACQAIAGFSESSAKSSLQRLAEYVTQRQR